MANNRTKNVTPRIVHHPCSWRIPKSLKRTNRMRIRTESISSEPIKSLRSTVGAIEKRNPSIMELFHSSRQEIGKRVPCKLGSNLGFVFRILFAEYRNRLNAFLVTLTAQVLAKHIYLIYKTTKKSQF